MQTKRPTVWVIKEQMKSGPNGPEPMDYTPAYEYGDLRFITEFDPPLHPGTIRAEWDKQVAKFIEQMDVDRDYLVLSGSPLAIFLIGAKLGECKGIGNLSLPRVLVWRREQGRYVIYN